MPYQRLTDAFSLKKRELISLAGAGGKTTFMYTLARELGDDNKKVITTTTTRIRIPAKNDTEKLIIDKDGKLPSDTFKKYKHVTCVAGIDSDGKAIGIIPSIIDEWKSTLNADCIIVEADGSKGKPFKAPIIEYEPIIPSKTTLYVPLVGIDILRKPLNEEYVHRPNIVAELTSTKLGDDVTISTVRSIMQYYLKIQPKSSRSAIYVNKVSNRFQREDAISLTREINSDRIFGDLLKKRFWRITK